MNRTGAALVLTLMICLTSCNLSSTTSPGTIPTATSPAAIPTVQPTTASNQATDTAQPTGPEVAKADYLLPELLTRFTPPPIIAIPKNSVQIEGVAYDAYQVPGNRIRVVCMQPCPLDDRLIDAAYAGYQESIQQLVRVVGFDVVDAINPIDIHLTRDDSCQRPSGEIGSSGPYPDNPNSVAICLYINEPDITQNDPQNPLTPETAIRLGGLGVFVHEYTHTLFDQRFTFSSHDFVFPIEWNTLTPSDYHYSNMCDPEYAQEAPLTYQLCTTKGFTFKQLIQSLQAVDRLYQGGYGNVYGMVGLNQYRAILNNILGSDVTQVFTDVGYDKMMAEEGSTGLYQLPSAGEACSYQALLAGDGAIPLGTMEDFNAPFEKTWQIKNTGTCSWDGVQLAFVRGEAMTATTSVPVPTTAAGVGVEVSVPMTAPGAAGVYSGEWQVRDSTGHAFGPIINMMIYTRPGCTLPSEFSYFKAEPATIGPGALAVLSWGQVTNLDKLEIIGLGSQNPNGDILLVQPAQTTTYTLQATCGSNTATSQATVTVDTSLPAFAITDVSATADPADFSGSCGAYGKRINFTGQYVVNGPGAVIYHWDRSDSAGSDSAYSILDQAGSQTVTTYWQIGGSMHGWQGFTIQAPFDRSTVRAQFTISCTP